MADHSLFFHLDSNLPDTVVYQRLEPSPYSEKFERNLNTGGNNFDESAGVVAHNQIHHSKKYPSVVRLPIVKK